MYGFNRKYRLSVGAGNGRNPLIFNGTALFDRERILIAVSVGAENQCIGPRRRRYRYLRRRIVDYHGIAFGLCRIVIVIGSRDRKIVGSVGRNRTGIEHTVPAQRLRYLNAGFYPRQKLPE